MHAGRSVEQSSRESETTRGVRTVLVDRTLHAELDGYSEYVERVRYRLLPGVW